LSDPPEAKVTRELADELLQALIRLARADFSVRLPRDYSRDTHDVLAMFVNLIAEELDRLTTARELQRKKLEDGVAELSEAFLGLAAGDFRVRASRTNKGDPIDVLAFLFNNTAAEVGDAFATVERQRTALEAILESMIDGVLLLDGEGRVRRANGAIERLLGSGPLAGLRFDELVIPLDRDFASSLVTAVDLGPIRDREVTFVAADGETISLAVAGSAQRDTTGAVAGVVIVTRDDRQLKLAHAQLQLADRLATMGTVAAGVAHEINNPLAFVISNLDFAVEELEGAASGGLDAARIGELLKALRASQAGAERVRVIVRDLKTFSRVDQSAVANVQVNRLLDAALSMIRNEVRHHATLVKEYGEPPPVEANEARVVQVFLNLIQNAAQAIPPGDVDNQRIRLVTGATPEGDALVEVHDTGSGITPENRRRIFDAFFTTKPVGVGTGLGLPICEKIVTSLGGRIEVESKVGEGAMFRVVLPAASGPSAPRSSRVSGKGGSKARRAVLVVDDEAEVGAAVARILGKEHDVVTVTRGAAALELLEDRTFDVILCDIMMPEMTGMELYERIVATSPDVARRIVFMTGGTFGSGVHEFLSRVPNERIDKPFDRVRLRALVDAP
jgi:two-component system NtrC family sensor kinase